MTTVAIVQARMGSSRLPGKVLEEIAGRSMLAWVLGRVARAKEIDDVVVATTTKKDDDAVVAEAKRLGVKSFRGSEDDVLDRYYGASKMVKANEVVRITSDCPLIDPVLVDQVIEGRRNHNAGYATLVRFPRGLDAEAFTASGLEQVWRLSTLPYERTHVTPYFYQHPELYSVAHVSSEEDLSANRWTVDTADDLRLIRAMVARLPKPETRGFQEFLRVCEGEPELSAINAHVRQKALEEG